MNIFVYILVESLECFQKRFILRNRRRKAGENLGSCHLSLKIRVPPLLLKESKWYVELKDIKFKIMWGTRMDSCQ